MYPVDKQAAQTLIPLIERHVSPGSRIFTDSCAAYLHLNELGYEHFFWCTRYFFLPSHYSDLEESNSGMLVSDMNI
jgi:transposase-like protein